MVYRSTHKKNPVELGYAVDVEGDCRGVEESDIHGAVKGVATRARIQMPGWQWSFYLSIQLTCWNYPHLSSAAYKWDVRFARNAPPPQVFYQWNYGGIGTSSEKKLIIHDVKLSIEEAIIDYVAINFDLN